MRPPMLPKVPIFIRRHCLSFAMCWWAFYSMSLLNFICLHSTVKWNRLPVKWQPRGKMCWSASYLGHRAGNSLRKRTQRGRGHRGDWACRLSGMVTIGARCRPWAGWHSGQPLDPAGQSAHHQHSQPGQSKQRKPQGKKFGEPTLKNMR